MGATLGVEHSSWICRWPVGILQSQDGDPVFKLQSPRWATSDSRRDAIQVYAKGPRTPIIGFQGPNTMNISVVGLQHAILWVLGPLGSLKRKQFLGKF